MAYPKGTEEAVGAAELALKNVPDSKMIVADLSVGQIKDALKKAHDFIDFAKFTFGEDITE
ncbi:MAG: hypothetical protein DRO87_11775 [Candidatus Thorarchaeota archaeon]|nr:MAG: hypothetical protein DRO87_11775 [Candidatus Thorarchaeota archaeon]